MKQEDARQTLDDEPEVTMARPFLFVFGALLGVAGVVSAIVFSDRSWSPYFAVALLVIALFVEFRAFKRVGS
ncbi:MAG: hypothetical protein LC785_12480 [Acidobacteria bacterium]|nr:hypothetical protein [Acidobacteriota bacterium]